jgi:hypothetical protein
MLVCSRLFRCPLYIPNTLLLPSDSQRGGEPGLLDEGAKIWSRQTILTVGGLFELTVGRNVDNPLFNRFNVNIENNVF